MEKKRYNIPTSEILWYKTQSLMKTGSDLPPDPNETPAPERKPKAF